MGPDRVSFGQDRAEADIQGVRSASHPQATGCFRPIADIFERVMSLSMMRRFPPVVRAGVRDGFTLAGCLLLVILGGLTTVAGVMGCGAGWKAWAMPVTGILMILVAARMAQVRYARENRIRRAGHTRRVWARSNR